MMNMWATLSQDLIDVEQEMRRAEIVAIHKQRRALEIAGYVPLSTRVRVRIAGWLLRLAIRLDERVAEGGPRMSPLPHA